MDPRRFDSKLLDCCIRKTLLVSATTQNSALAFVHLHLIIASYLIWVLMRASAVLRMHSARLTLFTRANCSLCDTAKTNVMKVREKRPVDYREINVMSKGHEGWKDLYEFDTPVLHVQRVSHTYSKPDIVSEAKKLMHRFSSEEIEKLVDEAEAGIT